MRTGQEYWRTLLKVGGCESKAQSWAVWLFLNQSHDGSIDLNGKGVPMGRDYRQVARLLNEMGFRTVTGKLWKSTRAQQVIINGLARSAAFHAVFLDRNDLQFRRNFGDAIAKSQKEMESLFQRKRKVVRLKVRTSVEMMVVNGESVVHDRPRLTEQYWAVKKEAARSKGWKSPEKWFSAPSEERYPSKRREL